MFYTNRIEGAEDISSKIKGCRLKINETPSIKADMRWQTLKGISVGLSCCWSTDNKYRAIKTCRGTAAKTRMSERQWNAACVQSTDDSESGGLCPTERDFCVCYITADVVDNVGAHLNWIKWVQLRLSMLWPLAWCHRDRFTGLISIKLSSGTQTIPRLTFYETLRLRMIPFLKT